MKSTAVKKFLQTKQHVAIQIIATAINVLAIATIFIGLSSRTPKPTLATNPPSQGEEKTSSAVIPPLPSPPLGPVAINDTPPPAVTAKAVVIIDPLTNTILFEKNPHQRLLPASTTKIMTGLIALEVFQPNEVVTITDADKSIGQTSNLVSGEQITVENLLYALLVNSGNDAALALARHYPAGYSTFVDRMNQKAAELGLLDTHYTNVSGVEQEAHYSTAADLSRLAKEAMKNSLFAQIVGTKSITIQSIDGRFVRKLTNLNQLLGKVDGVLGIKTGWTDNAGECLVSFTNRNGHELIIVVLGSADRFGESTALINWAYAHHQWE